MKGKSMHFFGHKEWLVGDIAHERLGKEIGKNEKDRPMGDYTNQ